MKIINPQTVYDKLEKIEKQLFITNIVYLSAEEASKLLNISITYLYELTSKKLIPHYKPSGKKLLFKKSDLINWIEKNRIKSISEFEKELNQNKN